MDYIAVVECVSSGILYIDEIIAHGCKPLVINTNVKTHDLDNYRKMLRENLKDRVEFLDEGEDFDALMEELRGYKIKAVFPGSEYGVRLADRLTAALGLKGNDEKTTYLRCTKEGMHEALGKAGIRRIETEKVKSESDIEEFWKKNKLDKCVLKFSESAATVGLKICSSLDEAIEHYKLMRGTENYRGETGSDILIQEYISGTEYIVNTLSCDGKHMLTDVWSYAKVQARDGTLAYDYAKLVKDLEPGHIDMIRYAYKVLDAVDMKWGLCHIEIKIDRKGPVLIETNARPMGLAMTASYLDEVLGYHLTDLAIETYFRPSTFNKYARRIYNPPKYALMKLLIVPEKIKGSFGPTFLFSNLLRSTREILFFGKEEVSTYPRTIDLETCPLVVKMVNPDYGALMKDYEMIRLIESNYFHLLYSSNNEVPAVEPHTDIEGIIKTLYPSWRFAVVKDDGVSIAQNGKMTELDNWSIFDGAIYAKCGKDTTEERCRTIFRTILTVRSGGLFIIAPESFSSMEDGSVIVEFIMNIAGVHVIAPSYDSNGLIYGLKK